MVLASFGLVVSYARAGLMIFGICEMYGIFQNGFEVEDEACERE
jgi:hypothetical protein